MSMKSSLYYFPETGFHIYEDQNTGNYVVEAGGQSLSLAPTMWALIIATLKDKVGF